MSTLGVLLDTISTHHPIPCSRAVISASRVNEEVNVDTDDPEEEAEAALGLVKITSGEPRAAARAAAILKQILRWGHQEEQNADAGEEQDAWTGQGGRRTLSSGARYGVRTKTPTKTRHSMGGKLPARVVGEHVYSPGSLAPVGKDLHLGCFSFSWTFVSEEVDFRARGDIDICRQGIPASLSTRARQAGGGTAGRVRDAASTISTQDEAAAAHSRASERRRASMALHRWASAQCPSASGSGRAPMSVLPLGSPSPSGMAIIQKARDEDGASGASAGRCKYASRSRSGVAGSISQSASSPLSALQVVPSSRPTHHDDRIKGFLFTYLPIPTLAETVPTLHAKRSSTPARTSPPAARPPREAARAGDVARAPAPRAPAPPQDACAEGARQSQLELRGRRSRKAFSRPAHQEALGPAACRPYRLCPAPGRRAGGA
ncbi:hypothetical protein C8R45DRAFT_1082704 [Mycena sanguinolenta]|nr:hypothetical protein C8R45DRAFT_1082704 [Mycena sanguinolenta]